MTIDDAVEAAEKFVGKNNRTHAGDVAVTLYQALRGVKTEQKWQDKRIDDLRAALNLVADYLKQRNLGRPADDLLAKVERALKG